MSVPFVKDDFLYTTSGVMADGGVVIHHQEYNSAFYQYECGRSFLDICVEMGLDSDDTKISL